MIEKQIKKNKNLNLNSHALKSEKEEKSNLIEKGSMTVNSSIIYKNTNSQLSKLLMSHKKENQCFNESNNPLKKIYHKGKIKT